MLLLGLGLQLGELLGALIPLGVELLQGLEGGGRERAGKNVSAKIRKRIGLDSQLFVVTFMVGHFWFQRWPVNGGGVVKCDAS